jgi:HD-GYP domain-containing protein (c-di-GMP phosphodiesterase class II)
MGTVPEKALHANSSLLEIAQWLDLVLGPILNALPPFIIEHSRNVGIMTRLVVSRINFLDPRLVYDGYFHNGYQAVALTSKGFLTDNALQIVSLAGLYHDIGKGPWIDLYCSSERLTTAQMDRQKGHTIESVRIIRESVVPFLEPVRALEHAARYHHERLNGSGYEGLRGNEIPLLAEIVGIADSFDAMTGHRPYRDALRAHEAIDELDSCAQRGEYDPQLVLLFRNVVESIT